MAATIKGTLGSLDNAGDGVLRDIYTVPASRAADVNINVANSADVDTQIKIAHIKNGVAAAVTNKDYLLGRTVGLPTGSLSSNLAPIEFNGILMEAGDTIAVSTSDSAVAVQINGIEEDA